MSGSVKKTRHFVEFISVNNAGCFPNPNNCGYFTVNLFLILFDTYCIRIRNLFHDSGKSTGKKNLREIRS